MARRLASEFALFHEIITTDEMARPEYRANPENRGYYCKHELFSSLTGIARARGFRAVVDGSNADDRGDYRPGRQAARELGVRSPLDASASRSQDRAEQPLARYAAARLPSSRPA